MAAALRRWVARLAVPCAVLAAAPAQAGPPYRTDDPEPVDIGHSEVYAFSAATHFAGDIAGTLAGIDANYGAAPGLQLHAALPIAFDSPDGRFVAGLGDVELGAKYRFVTDDEDGWRPQMAIYPTVDFPTGNAERGLGTGRTHLFLPLWLQKSFAEWTSFAGVGHWSNPGPGSRDYWYYGWALQRQLAPNLAVGAELFHQSANAVGTKDQTGFDLGVTYDLDEHYHLLFSAGQGIHNRSTTNVFTYYAALQVTY